MSDLRRAYENDLAAYHACGCLHCMYEAEVHRKRWDALITALDAAKGAND